MLDAVTRWTVRQFAARKTPEQCVAIASAMLETYYSDPEYYGGTTLWRLYEASNASVNL